MTDPSDTVADVVLARLEALRVGAEGGDTTTNLFGVFDALVPDSPPDRYLVLYPDSATRSRVALAGGSDEHTYRWQITTVGPARWDVEWLKKRVLDDLVDLVLQVPGLECAPITHDFTQPIRPDDRVIPNRTLLYGVDGFEMSAQPTE